MKKFKKHIFLHIPKTAGTTLSSLIASNYTTENRIALYEAATFQRDLKSALNKGKSKIIYGHFDYSEVLNNAEFYVFTFLREPVSRTISNYLHLKYSKDQQHIEQFKSVKSFDDFLQLKQANNWQTRHLAGEKFDENFGADLKSSLEKATSTLNRLNFVGITEQFNDSVKCLSTDLGWKKLEYLSQNKGSNSAEGEAILNEYREQIEAKNQLDIILYNLGKQLLEAKITQNKTLKKSFFRF